MRGTRSSRAAAALGLALTLLVAAPETGRADGLHCKVLDGVDLEAAWRRFVAEIWPGQTVAPRVSKHENPRVRSAIQELLAVLQFVDPYNYADDSPAWMGTETGRDLGRTQARAILLELGRGAADLVADALVQELRFPTAKTPPDKFVPAFREAQRKLKAAQETIETQRMQDEEYRTVRSEFEKLRPVLNTIKALDKEEQDWRRFKIRYRNDAAQLAKVEAQLDAVAKRKAKLGEAAELGLKLKFYEDQLQQRIAALDAEPGMAALKAPLEAARKELQDAQKSSFGLGQGGDVTGGDPAMVTTEDYLAQLQGTLVEMGPEALPAVLRFKSNPNPEVRERITQILKAWEVPAQAKTWALAAADGHTPVALKAQAHLRDTLKLKAVGPLLAALKEAPEAEHPAYFAALKLVSSAAVENDLAKWEAWWAQTKKETSGQVPVVEEEK